MATMPTKQELVQKATATAKAVRELNAKTTTASGAVVGGPAPVTPTTAPAAGGQGS